MQPRVFFALCPQCFTWNKYTYLFNTRTFGILIMHSMYIACVCAFKVKPISFCFSDEWKPIWVFERNYYECQDMPIHFQFYALICRVGTLKRLLNGNKQKLIVMKEALCKLIQLDMYVNRHFVRYACSMKTTLSKEYWKSEKYFLNQNKILYFLPVEL